MGVDLAVPDDGDDRDGPGSAGLDGEELPARALERRAAEIGARATNPTEATAGADEVVLSVPWPTVEQAKLEQAGPLAGKVLIDTTNPFGRGGWEVPAGQTSTMLHQQRLPRASVVKAFNTLTAGFQAAAAGRNRQRPGGDLPGR